MFDWLKRTRRSSSLPLTKTLPIDPALFEQGGVSLYEALSKHWALSDPNAYTRRGASADALRSSASRYEQKAGFRGSYRASERRLCRRILTLKWLSRLSGWDRTSSSSCAIAARCAEPEIPIARGMRVRVAYYHVAKSSPHVCEVPSLSRTRRVMKLFEVSGSHAPGLAAPDGQSSRRPCAMLKLRQQIRPFGCGVAT